MQSLESLSHSLSLDDEALAVALPGSQVTFPEEKDKSSHVTLAASGGVISKTKKRKPEKALYEFLSLSVWNALLANYSSEILPSLRAPKPMGFSDLDSNKSTLHMEFLPGHKLKSLGILRRSTPVHIDEQMEPLPLYAGCAYHLGALDAIKEREELFHSDYDGRHVVFNPNLPAFMGVIDVENSRVEPYAPLVQKESAGIVEVFERHVSSPKDHLILGTWYQQGREEVDSLGVKIYLGRVLEEVSRRYSVDFDMLNGKINGQRVL